MCKCKKLMNFNEQIIKLFDVKIHKTELVISAKLPKILFLNC